MEGKEEKMKIKELIKKLNKHNLDKDVVAKSINLFIFNEVSLLNSPSTSMYSKPQAASTIKKT